jgi:hypothetical protein
MKWKPYATLQNLLRKVVAQKGYFAKDDDL